MKRFSEFLEAMGGMHDAIVQMFSWNPSDRTIEFRFCDIYSNFEGLPEHPGRQSGAIRFLGVRDIVVNIQMNEDRLRVFELLLRDRRGASALMTFSPTGRIEFNFDLVTFPEIDSRLLERNPGQTPNNP